ncbi:Uncharacterised protein [Eikenella corrodens]|uniref:Uncharacterized protein n=1 Tax=Eikenella corrodens TaxID=539 RepID=A0A8B4G3T2_EIKCO|nr:Uncharacterised protein [Eikenella corrodens]
MLSVVLGAALVVVLVRHVVVDIRGKKAVLGDSIRLVSKVGRCLSSAVFPREALSQSLLYRLQLLPCLT